jgi:hypothetical protein
MGEVKPSRLRGKGNPAEQTDRYSMWKPGNPENTPSLATDGTDTTNRNCIRVSPRDLQKGSGGLNVEIRKAGLDH